ncbi:SH3-domain kinase binding protein 1, partial [Entomortierella beljakovae]
FVDPYVEKVGEPTPETSEAAAASTEETEAPASEDTAPKNEGPVLARVEYDYEAKESGELSLEVGRVVTIIDSHDPAWWKGDLNGKIGSFPSNYVKIIDNKEEEAVDKPAKFRLAAFGVKQGGLGSLFAGGVVPGLKKTGGLKKLTGVEANTADESPRSPIAAPTLKSVLPPVTPPVAQPAAQSVVKPVEEAPIAPLANPIPVRATPAVPDEIPAPSEPRVPSRAKKPKSKQIKALVIYEYTAQEEDEISLAKGSTVVVTDKMGDEGWWSGRNEQGESGNFPSDFVQEIKEEVQSPPVTPSIPTAIDPQNEASRPPSQHRHSVALPAIPTEPIREEPVIGRANEVPLATPPPLPRGSRPPSMIASPLPTQLHHPDPRTLNEGPPLPSSPPPKRTSMASRSNSVDYPSSPRHATVTSSSSMEPASPTTSQPITGDLSRSSTLRRPQKPIPEAPLNEADEQQDSAVETVDTSSSNSNRNSYILPTPVSRNRPLPPLARPPSIHQENRKSLVIPTTPTTPGEQQEVAAHVEPVLEKLGEEDEETDEIVEKELVTSPETIHTEPEVHETVSHEEPVHDKPITAAPAEAVESEEKAEETQEEQIESTEVAHVEEAVEEEKEPEKPKLPEMESSGPALSHASRPRPAKGRKPPSTSSPNPDSSFVSQLEAEVKAAPIEEKKPEPVVPQPTEKVERAPPPKPVKPIFQKFPTPFAGAQPPSINLRPTGRRTSGNEDSSTTPATGHATAPVSAASVPPPAGGVKSLGSRFGQFQGVPTSGGGSTAALELEIAKLRRFINEELDRVRKELSDERDARLKLQDEVSQLRAQLG